MRANINLFCSNMPKINPIVFNKCTQNFQLCTKNTLDSVVAFTMYAANYYHGN